MAKDPNRRYATATDLVTDLTRYLNGEPINARPPSLVEISIRKARRIRGLLTGLGVGVAAVAIIGILLLLRRAELIIEVDPPEATILLDGRPLDPSEARKGIHLSRGTYTQYRSVKHLKVDLKTDRSRSRGREICGDPLSLKTLRDTLNFLLIRHESLTDRYWA